MKISYKTQKQVLREKFFKECVDRKTAKDHNGIDREISQHVNMAPHDLFEWFVKNMK